MARLMNGTMTMTTLQDRETTVRVSGASIVLGSLIGVGYCIGLGVIAGAVAMSIGLERLELPEGGMLLLVSALAIVVLTFAYFIAGFVAAKVAHQEFRFDSVLHSLGAWSTMSILIMVLIVIASMVQTARSALDTLNIPPVVTKVSILPPQATTTVQPPAPVPAKPTPETAKADLALLVAWWIACIALLGGAGTSIAGGLVGRRRALIAGGKKASEETPVNDSHVTT
jgi:hypothetical protein